MGRANILANLGDGRYTIELDFGSQRLQAQLQLFADANTQIDTKLSVEQGKKSSLLAELVSIDAAVTAAVNAYVAQVNADPNNAQAELDALTRAKETQARKEAEIAAVQRTIDVLNFDKQKNLQQIALYNQARQTLVKDAWCADYTTTATGEVATIDIPGDPNLTLICPGGRAPTSADGEFLSRASMTGAQAYFNAAIFPGWQKFKPTYRSGTITAIRINNFADVILDAAESSAQGLNVNQTNALLNIPVSYMGCDAFDAFEPGDKVIVEFIGQNWLDARVIGFLEEPVDCAKAMELLFDLSLGSGNIIEIPLEGNVNVTVNWGDGNTDQYTSAGLKTHFYSISGVYVVKITGQLEHFGIVSEWTVRTNAAALTKVNKFGELGLISLRNAFSYCSNLTEVSADFPNTVTDISYIFNTCYNFDYNIDSWDVGNVTNMEGAFLNTDIFNQPLDSWNVSSVTSTRLMFTGALKFNQALNSWDVSSVTDMRDMFYSAFEFNGAIDNWDVSNVTQMFGIFVDASDFNQNISGWNVSNIVDLCKDPGGNVDNFATNSSLSAANYPNFPSC